MKKVFIIFIIVICLLISSCNKKTTVVNNVINQTVDIEDTVKIEKGCKKILERKIRNYNNSCIYYFFFVPLRP